MSDMTDYNGSDNLDPQREELEKLLDDANIPSLPQVACKLIELCKDPNANFADFARVIESDMGLSSRLLRVVNSAFYGLRTKATNIERAINALGLKYVRSICLGFHLVDTLSRLAPAGFDMNVFWQESLLRAVIARRIASKSCPELREEAFLVGLLQNCGILVLCQVYGPDYVDIWSRARSSPATLHILEQETFQLTHLDASESLCRRWNLPDLLVLPIANHHRPSQKQFSFDETVKLSQVSYFVGNLALNDPEVLCPEDDGLLDLCRTAFSIETEELLNMLRQSKDEYAGVVQLFSKFINEPVNVSEIIEKARGLIRHLDTDVPKEMLEPEKYC